jgi:hypothetical protein
MRHLFAGADSLFIDTAEGRNRRSHPLRAKAGERLGVLAVYKCGHRQQLRRRHYSLSATTVNANLQHVFISSWSLHPRVMGFVRFKGECRRVDPYADGLLGHLS